MATDAEILMNVHHLLVNTTVLILLGVLRAFVEKVMNLTVMEGPALLLQGTNVRHRRVNMSVLILLTVLCAPVMMDIH